MSIHPRRGNNKVDGYAVISHPCSSGSIELQSLTLALYVDVYIAVDVHNIGGSL